MKTTLSLAFLFLLALGSRAETVVQASNLAQFRAAISNAAPGTRIVLADGAHTLDDLIVIRRAGLSNAPIVIEAATVGGAEFKGDGGITFEAPAAHVVLRGFRFLSRAGRMHLPAGVHHSRVTRNTFQMVVPEDGRATFLTVAGDDIEIDRNTFQHKSTEGQMLYVHGPGSSGMAQRAWIHHNYFYDFKPSRKNNSSALHIGHSARSLTSAFALVEHNLFVDCYGENEGAICNKSGDNTYRYNTFAGKSTELSLRHGNVCLVYGNFFIGTAGLRFFGDDHRIFNNYFEDCRPAIAIGNGGANVPPAALTSHDRPDRVLVVHNTLVNNRGNVQMSRRNNGLGAADLVFANNLIVGGNRAASLDGPLPNAMWRGNIIWGNEGGAGDLPPDGYEESNPGLVKDAAGLWRLSANSPVKTGTRYGFVSADMDGQERVGEPQIGADQFSSAPIENRPLSPKDVGPAAP